MLHILFTFGLVGLVGLCWMIHYRTMRLHAEVPGSGDVSANTFNGVNAELVLLSVAAQASMARAVESPPPAPAPDGSPFNDYILRQWEAEDSSYTEWAAAIPNEGIVPMM